MEHPPLLIEPTDSLILFYDKECQISTYHNHVHVCLQECSDNKLCEVVLEYIVASVHDVLILIVECLD